MLDKGLIEKADFDDIKKQCLIEMGMRAPSKSLPEEPSNASSFPSENEQNSDVSEPPETSLGLTNLKRTSTSEEDMDLFGDTRIDHEAQKDDVFSLFGETKVEGKSFGLTMLGRYIWNQSR